MCEHEEVEEHIWGKKKKYKAIVCKKCGLLLEIEELRKSGGKRKGQACDG